MMHICSTRSTRVSLQTTHSFSLFFFFFKLFLRLNYVLCFDVYERRYTSLPLISEPANCSRKKKKEKKIVQTNVRARQTALNNELDSQELVTHARNYD